MIKEAVYIYGFAKGANLPLTMKAVTYANDLHKDQKRDDGAEYFEHPIRVCRYLLNHGIRDDVTLTASLLHDIIEDTPTTREELAEIFGEEVANIVDLLSKKKKVPAEVYYKEITSDIRAIIIKAADRACNIDDMIDVFTIERLERYIKDTEGFVLPMMKSARRIYLEYSDALVSFRDHIRGVVKVAKKVIELSREMEKMRQMQNTSYA
jgi:GTP diphosphokinase / guanosine-3',5'-bis(diphosphate) 3'-diphosphatase